MNPPAPPRAGRSRRAWVLLGVALVVVGHVLAVRHGLSRLGFTGAAVAAVVAVVAIKVLLMHVARRTRPH
jgi:hypothetical protein